MISLRFFSSTRSVAGLAICAFASACSAAGQLPATTGTFGGVPSVTTPFRLVHGLVVIPVSLNGRAPVQLILDTASPVIVIPDTTLSRRLGFQIVGEARVNGTGDGTAEIAPLAAGITARVGAFEVSNAAAIIGVGRNAIPGVDGVIGGALFRHAVVEVDWDAGVVRFHDPSNASAPVAGDTIPLRVEQSLHAYVPGTVVMNGSTIRVQLHLDTGARQALTLSRATLSEFATKPRVAVATIVGFGSRGIARGDWVRADSVRLGSSTLTDVTTAVPTIEPGIRGRIGLTLLKRFNFAVDYPGHRLILQPRPAPEPFRFTTTGIVLTPARDSSHRVVADVIVNSPAHEAGVASGDSVIAVGSVDLVTLDLEGLDAAVLSPPPGAVLLLVTRRGAQRIERRLTARTLLP